MTNCATSIARLKPAPTATTRHQDEVTRADAELSWLDGPQGRVRVVRADDGWVSVNPLRPADLRFALDRCAMTARSSR